MIFNLRIGGVVDDTRLFASSMLLVAIVVSMDIGLGVHGLLQFLGDATCHQILRR